MMPKTIITDAHFLYDSLRQDAISALAMFSTHVETISLSFMRHSSKSQLNVSNKRRVLLKHHRKVPGGMADINLRISPDTWDLIKSTT